MGGNKKKKISTHKTSTWGKETWATNKSPLLFFGAETKSVGTLQESGFPVKPETKAQKGEASRSRKAHLNEWVERTKNMDLFFFCYSLHTSWVEYVSVARCVTGLKKRERKNAIFYVSVSSLIISLFPHWQINHAEVKSRTRVLFLTLLWQEN